MCNRAYLVDLSQSILTVGLMIGAVSFAALSDRFGRKPIFLLSQWATILVGIAVAASQTYPTFAALRFLIGILQQVLLYFIILIIIPCISDIFDFKKI